jgi:hypothetical protein
VRCALALALLVVPGCTLGRDAEPDTRAIVAAAGPAPWRGDGVLHARWRYRDVSVTIEGEEWLNLRTGASRQVTYDPSGHRQVQIVEGRREVRWYVDGRGRLVTVPIATRFPAGDRRLDRASALLSVWRRLVRGTARIVDDGRLGGRPVWEVELPLERGSEAPADLRVWADVDQRTFLPLRVGRESDSPLWTTTFALQYERSPESSISRSLFAVPGDWRIGDRRLAYRDLARTALFTPYVPRGDDGLRFSFGAFVTGQARTSGSRRFARSLYLAYGDAAVAGTPPLQLVEHRAPAAALTRPNVRVTIAGRLRPARVERGSFTVVLGGTLIQARTADAGVELRRVLASLEPLR